MANTVQTPTLAELAARLNAVEVTISNSKTTSAGAADAGSLVKLGSDGRLAASLLPTIAELGLYDVRRFGAIWDGNSHPLSERFATLAAARAVYPHAVALTDEIDWAAVQAAINQVVFDWDAWGKQVKTSASQRFGGTVLLPRGHGRLNRSIFYPASSNWTYQDYPSVNLLGHGRQNTFLNWIDNAAPVWEAMAVQPRTATVSGSTVTWSGSHSTLHALCIHRGFSLRGPGLTRNFAAPTSEADFIARYGFKPANWTMAYNRTNPTIGQIYEAYSGLSAGERTSLEDIGIYNFKYGLNLRGGQKWHRWLDITSCYYGVYGTFTASAHGDMVFTKCNFSGRMAAIAMHPAFSLYGHFDTCYIGGAPYAFLKEGSVERKSDADNRAAFGGHYGDFISGVLTHCQFESVGNAIFGEANLTRRHELRDLTLQNCEYREPADCSFPVSDAGVVGPILSDALVDVKSLRRVSIVRSHDPDKWRARGVSVFRASIVEDLRIDSADAFLLASSGKPFFKLVGTVAPGSVELSGNRWRGTLLRFGTNQNPDVAKGDLVSLVGLFGGKSTTASPIPFGVAMEANPDRTQDQYLVVGTSFVGAIPVSWDGTALPDNNAELAVGPVAGKCRPAPTGTRGFASAFGTNGTSQVWAVFR